MVILRPTHLPTSALREDYPAYQVPEEYASQLRRTPWCAEILNDPEWIPLHSHSRHPPDYLVSSHVSRTFFRVEVVASCHCICGVVECLPRLVKQVQALPDLWLL